MVEVNFDFFEVSVIMHDFLLVSVDDANLVVSMLQLKEKVSHDCVHGTLMALIRIYVEI